MRRPISFAKAPWFNEPRLQQVMAVLNTGGETRIAGGAVRNALLKKPINDIDLATTFTPADVVQLAKGAGFGVHPTGIEHGTVTVTFRGSVFEVTTLRRDVETDGRHAKVVFSKSFKEDAQRRDFTINALYVDRRGKLHDEVKGLKDIAQRRIRFVGKPAARITEDYLRVLRFFRFYAAYGKGAPDAKGLGACKRLRKGLAQISAERIRQELLKLLVAPRAVEALKVMAETGVLQQIIPYTEQWRVIKRLPEDGILRLMVLAESPGELKERLRLSNAESERIAAVATAPSITPKLRERERRAVLYEVGPRTWGDAVRVAWAKGRAAKTDQSWQKLLDLPEKWTAPVLPITGRDLLGAGLEAGPRVGALLKQAENHWIESDFSLDREGLLAYVKDHASES